MRLAHLTTLRVGGEPRELFEAHSRAQIVELALAAWGSGDEVFLLGGGSNVVVGDDGFDGTVIRVLSRGIAARRDSDGRILLTVEAGEPWEELVAYTVAQGWAGLEALSGIPGSTGAAPIQNIGAYGREIGESLESIEFLDYLTGDVLTLSAADLGLGYRTSAIKRGRQGVVLAATFALVASADGLSEPIEFDQLAAALGVAVGSRQPLAAVRAAVLALRASKGMVLDAADQDSVSAGSFFTNPIVSESFARTLPDAAPRWPVAADPQAVAVPLGEEPAAPQFSLPGATAAGEAGVKLSAAWLIERAGICRGFSLPGSGAAISSKHTLAITNTGTATAYEIVELARYVQTRVLAEFGVILHPEPTLVSIHL